MGTILDFFSRIKWKTVRIKEIVVSTYTFFKVIKKFAAYDYEYLLAINHAALEAMIIRQSKYKHLFVHQLHYELRKMQLVSDILKTTINNKDLIKETKDIKDEVYQLIYKSDTQNISNRIFYTLNSEYEKERKIISALKETEEQIKSRRIKLAFKIIAENIEKWWI